MSELIGSIVGGLSLVWGIYQWIIKRSDEAAKQKQVEIQNAIKWQRDAFEKEMTMLRNQNHEQEKEFEKLKLTVHSLMSQTKTQGQIFNDTTKRIEKVLDRHENKLDTFGKVTIK